MLYDSAKLTEAEFTRKCPQLRQIALLNFALTSLCAQGNFMLQIKPGDALVDPWLLQRCWADDSSENLCQPFDHPPRHCSSGF